MIDIVRAFTRGEVPDDSQELRGLAMQCNAVSGGRYPVGALLRDIRFAKLPRWRGWSHQRTHLRWCYRHPRGALAKVVWLGPARSGPDSQLSRVTSSGITRAATPDLPGH